MGFEVGPFHPEHGQCVGDRVSLSRGHCDDADAESRPVIEMVDDPLRHEVRFYGVVLALGAPVDPVDLEELDSRVRRFRQRAWEGDQAVFVERVVAVGDEVLVAAAVVPAGGMLEKPPLDFMRSSSDS